MLEVDAVAVGVDGTALDSGEGVIARWVGVVDPVELEFTEGVVVGVASGDDVEASAEAAGGVEVELVFDDAVVAPCGAVLIEDEEAEVGAVAWGEGVAHFVLKWLGEVG